MKATTSSAPARLPVLRVRAAGALSIPGPRGSKSAGPWGVPMKLSFLRLLRIATVLALSGASMTGQEPVKCPNGEVRLRVELDTVVLTYQAKTFETTLSGLRGLIKTKTSLDHQTVQEAYDATQQWNELLKGLVAGYNSCVISQQQYEDGLNRVYPRLHQDADDLEKIRKALANGEQADQRHLQRVLRTYFEDIRHFADASNDRIVEAIRIAVERALVAQDKQFDEVERVLSQKAKEIEALIASVPKPADVHTQIEEELAGRSQEAEQEYNQAYDLLQKYQFHEAIPHLRKAIAAVPLPAFGLALAVALNFVDSPREAEIVIRTSLSRKRIKPEYEILLNDLLSEILVEERDLAGAEQAARRGLTVAENSLEVSGSLLAMANVALGSVLQLEGRYSDAEPIYRHALDLVENAVGPNEPSESQEYDPALMDAMYGLTEFLVTKGDYKGAEELQRRVLDLTERVMPDSPLLAASLVSLADILREKGNYLDARPYYERALKIEEAIFGRDHLSVATTLNNLGLLLHTTGDYAAAEEFERQALAIREHALGMDHPLVAVSLNNIAGLLRVRADDVGAEQLYRRALAIHEKTLDNYDIAIDLDNLAQVVSPEEAGPLYRRAIDLEEQIGPPDNARLAVFLHNYASFLAESGDIDQAEQLYRRALAIDEKVLGPDHEDVAGDLRGLANILYFRGKTAETEQMYQRALQIDERALGPNHIRVTYDLRHLAELLEAKQDDSGAENLYRRVISIDEKLLPVTGDLSEALRDLARVLEREGRKSEARPLLIRSLDVDEDVTRRLLNSDEERLGSNDARIALDLTNLANLLLHQGLLDSQKESKNEEVVQLCRRAITINETNKRNDVLAAMPMALLAAVLMKQEKYHEVEDLARKTLAITQRAASAKDSEAQALTMELLLTMGGLMYRKGHYNDAERYLREALSIGQEATEQDDPVLFGVLIFLAETVAKKHDYGEAERLYMRALIISEKAFGVDDPGTSEIRESLAKVREKQKKTNHLQR
jgi:tetratricopeptide (TPR) repeat protein